MRRKIIQFLGVILILSLFGGISFYFIKTRPKVKKKPFKRALPLVEVLTLHKKSYVIKIYGEGTLYPEKEVILTPQVGGKIVYISPKLKEGGNFIEGELLCQIDKRDYKLAVKSAQARVKELEIQLKKLEIQAKQAEKEWKMFHSSPPPPLVIKKPDIEILKSKLEEAKIQLKKALLNLERTSIYAPFSGRSAECYVEKGMVVSPGTKLAKIYSTGLFKLKVYLAPEKIKWIKPGDKVLIYSDLFEKPVEGWVKGLGGEVDKKTGLVPVIIKCVPRSGLIPGDFVKVEILAQKIRAFYLPFIALKGANLPEEGGENIVWIVDSQDKIHPRKVKILYVGKEGVLIKEGLKEGERIVLSPLPVFTKGMKVKTKAILIKEKL